ncbi:hypothetical protein FIBSPDRAFT_819107 [Athelia psychrophila]|uniref:Zn(2)-C6 fungal-type domain-containing protein n=1 Tax=Athelia psychrophila TaxID=1759441 RepID=A0A166Q6Y5_9AGAM|nr:hypothetical protein FIBSPDRAFT_819107 [Fibularhizoctonia sp. CBS 109695]
MPADSHNKYAPRPPRASSKSKADEDIELKRARGEISCAECRRSKLKCDKDVPCGSCVRRGCSTVCPNGSFTMGNGTRFVLADTEQLHRTIAEMSQRIRQLEDALAVLQSSISSGPHSLLRDDLLSIKYGTQKPPSKEPEISDDVPAETVDAFGTLTIGDSGEARYFGASAGSETLLLAGAELERDDYTTTTDLKYALDHTIQSAAMFFLSSRAAGDDTFENAMTILFASLPPRPRAWSLCETYLENACGGSRPVSREELIEEALTPIYDAKKAREYPMNGESVPISPFKFALLYLCFAQGVLTDLTLAPCSEEGETYHHLACVALALRSIFDSPTTEAVQSILVMAHYRSGAGKRYTPDSVWALGSLACKLAQSIGMHRDPARWNMGAKCIEKRRRLFWEVYSTDLFFSQAFGRPPALEASYIDCAYPENDASSEASFWRWKYVFSGGIFASVLKVTQAASPPSYKTILEIDRRIREMKLSPDLDPFLVEADRFASPKVFMKNCILTQFRMMSLLYVHRSFFAQALLDHPENPLRSPYAPSFLAAYRSASDLIRVSVGHIQRYPELLMRWWAIWTQLFSCAIIVGSIITKAPSSSFAPAAFNELGLVVDIFEKGSKSSERARNGMPILIKLKEKASLAMSRFRSGAASPIFNSEEDGADELAIFGGQTRILVRKTLSQKSSSWDMSSNQVEAPRPLYATAIGTQFRVEDVHPSLVEYMSGIDQTSFPTEFAGDARRDVQNHAISLDQSSCGHDINGPSYFPRFVNPLVPGPPLQQPSASFLDDPNMFYPFQQLQPEAPPTDAVALDAWGSSNATDLNTMIRDDDVVDEQWAAFMRESGMII